MKWSTVMHQSIKTTLESRLSAFQCNLKRLQYLTSIQQCSHNKIKSLRVFVN